MTPVPQAGISPSFWPECPLRLPHHALTGLSRALTRSHGPLSYYQSPVSRSSPPLLAQHCPLPAFANKTRRTAVENLRAFAFHDSYRRRLGPLRTLHILDSHIALPGSPDPSRPNLVISRFGNIVELHLVLASDGSSLYHRSSVCPSSAGSSICLKHHIPSSVALPLNPCDSHWTRILSCSNGCYPLPVRDSERASLVHQYCPGICSHQRAL